MVDRENLRHLASVRLTCMAASIMTDNTCWVAPRHFARKQRLRGYQSNNASLVSECWSFRMLHLDSLYYAIFQVAGLSYGSFHSVGLRAARRVPLRRTAAAVVSRPDRRCSPHASFFSGVYSWLVMTFNYLIL